ncbi:ribokinase [Virgibacillus ndiopensis]|uniref:ribokinase n=1 Tax=Virgibacillus ndiopensis TaxID=2004408 RepID=UPI000C06E8EE|nr:ribokinase [Virgibacillus ndiopensis]
MAVSSTVCIVGSINMDLSISTNTIPKQGETVIGGEFATYPGGKGANQAVAAARLGSSVNMIGAIGNDTFGATLLDHLESEGINYDGIETIPDVATGIANIILSENDNRIIVSSGANRLVTPDFVERHRDVINKSDIVLLQLEIPMETVVHTLKIANEYGIPVIVNPAPYQQLPEAVFSGSAFLTPNEIELLSMKTDPKFTSIQENVIVTQGERGVQFYENREKRYLPSHHVEAKDTTGAGDTFNGALASQLGRGAKLTKAIEYANAAAALSVTKIGAQGGMPTGTEVDLFIKERTVS